MQRRRFVITLSVSALLSALFGIRGDAQDSFDFHGVPATTSGGARFSFQPTTFDPAVPSSQYSFIHSANAGDVITDSIRVTNIGDTAGTVRLFPVDATTAQTSGVVYFNETDTRIDVGAWVSIDGTGITLNPNESRDVPFTLTVPPSALRPGQHLGGLIGTGAPPPSGGQVTIVSRAAVPIVVNLPPPLTERFTLPALSLAGTKDRPQLLVGLRNDGNILQKPTVGLVVKDLRGNTVLTVPAFALDTFVPQTQIGYPLALAANALAAGDYQVTVTATYGSGSPPASATATFPLAYFFSPQLTSIGTQAGPPEGGTSVTLYGFGFGTTSDTQVFIDGTAVPAANIQSITSRSIRFTTPPHAAGNVTITAKVGGVAVSGAAPFQYAIVNVQPPMPHASAPPVGPVNPMPVVSHLTQPPTVNTTATPNASPTRR